jgi:hypothetical protein
MSTEPHYANETVTLYAGDCLDILHELPGASVDAVVTDPPYGLGFMGKEWDDLPPGREWAAECLRVLKPGGHLLAFGGSRTWHRLAVAIEDAGFELRDSIAWLYGSGFPKSLDVSKAIDKAAGAEREVLSSYARSGRSGGILGTATEIVRDVTAPATPDAERWQGWGTALKPAFEPIVVARKPLTGTVAANVLAHGTGALNIDGCRIEGAFESGWSKSGSKASENNSMSGANYARDAKPDNAAGRWPANVVLDESQAAELDEQSGTLKSGANPTRRGTDKFRDAYGDFKGQEECVPARGVDTGGASRFFYTAKADAGERVRVNGTAHPTVKPLSLMRWLVRLVTPPGGTVLEPFAGSGTTIEACALEGFRCIAIEREADYLPLIIARLGRQDPLGSIGVLDDRVVAKREDEPSFLDLIGGTGE